MREAQRSLGKQRRVQAGEAAACVWDVSREDSGVVSGFLVYSENAFYSIS